jgi:AAA domain
MFFGRRQERNDLLSMGGSASHLVYGGRQLGKTALLRRIQAEQQGSKDRIVAYAEIRNIGGSDLSPTRAITRVMAEELRRAGVPVPTNPSWHAFEAAVEKWLDEPDKEDRRILLMLDEADAFLRADSRDKYRELQQIKSLIERTGRHFKVVFAGLQNVERFFRDPNSPWQHFGSATLIGPMLRGDELREAERLVRQPLETLGFSFPDPDAVRLLLVYSNYYPSLIQVFCRRLLVHARTRWLQHSEHPLPFPITVDDIRRVYSESELRHEIRDKLQITLNLDPRYNYLVMLLAVLSAGGDPATLIEGVSLPDLRDQALVELASRFRRCRRVS